MKQMQVLGSGCENCARLANNFEAEAWMQAYSQDLRERVLRALDRGAIKRKRTVI